MLLKITSTLPSLLDNTGMPFHSYTNIINNGGSSSSDNDDDDNNDNSAYNIISGFETHAFLDVS